MDLFFSPVRRDDALTLEVSGDTLTVNGEALDFSVIPIGGTMSGDDIGCEMIAAVGRDDGGMLAVTVILPVKPGATEAARFPEPMTDVPDGPVSLSALV